MNFQGHVLHAASLCLTLSVLDLGQNDRHLYQSPAQPRTRENDIANNIITALVHISLIWQKPSLSSVSHMVQCSIIGMMCKHEISDTIVVSVTEIKTYYFFLPSLIKSKIPFSTSKYIHGQKNFKKWCNPMQKQQKVWPENDSSFESTPFRHSQQNWPLSSSQRSNWLHDNCIGLYCNVFLLFCPPLAQDNNIKNLILIIDCIFINVHNVGLADCIIHSSW